jgi:drug/metabolite transporter (DMT)-like permease
VKPVHARRRATLAGAAAISLWSALAVLTVATGTMPPFQLLATSFAIGGCTILAGSLLWQHQGLAALRQPPGAFVLATVALFGYHGLYFAALKSAPAVEANLINYLWPLLIVLLAALVPGQRARPAQYLGSMIGLVGAVVVVTRGERPDVESAHVAGYLAALGAALVWACYSVANRRYADVPSSTIAGPCLLVAVLGAVAHLLFESTVTPTTGQWLAIAIMGLGPVGAAFLFWDIGTKRGDLALLGTLAYAAPLFSTFWLLLAGHSEPHWSQGVACLLIASGGLLSVMSARTHPATGGTLAPESAGTAGRSEPPAPR